MNEKSSVQVVPNAQFCNKLLNMIIKLFLFHFQRIFKGLHITDIQETTLGANQLLDEYKIKERYSWDIKGTPLPVPDRTADKSKYEISLGPMEIRSFIVKFAKGPASYGNVFKPVFYFVFSLVLSQLML